MLNNLFTKYRYVFLTIVASIYAVVIRYGIGVSWPISILIGLVIITCVVYLDRTSGYLRRKNDYD